MDRLYFDKINSVGTFPDNRIKMDIVFQDGRGNEYVWTPKWEEVMSIYAESERVEELNVAEGKWLDDIKEKKEFSIEVLYEIAELIVKDRSMHEIAEFFESAGFDGEYFRYSTTDLDVRSEKEKLGNRICATKNKMTELNEEDYRYIVQVVSKLGDPKQYIGEEDQHEKVIDDLNRALEFENMMVTNDGRVLPLKREE